jgi:hypothetical protein
VNTRELMGLPDKAHAGPTLVEQLWLKLDGAYARWRRYRQHARNGEELPAEINLDFMHGRVVGLVQAIAIMSRGVLDENGVKAECLRRWKDRQGLDKSQPPADA